mmetsp:Transcript_2747/g.4435  ORF Transcript_2747/g.4435 Transcript_2747/m.4435 type:complete len:502 (-) Transcript_2747:127-1632(-)|eukprot:CAMPEP_0119016428 /NCGR_PEP_ID=MMETSP1176-20130426/12916_1 /TAXON_ID=265551 /ORGANISM="Synedropsis recta cf, Strain CCMP1620" /LENGTH=501 /DNA_ID=CAMNT_0006969835 /DNA_START=28 /DNA_END=1533 /DNA_ORIENTATION=-
MVAYLITTRGSRLVRGVCRRGLRQKSTDADISRNGGVVEGVWVFARHGDRTPSRPLCAPHRKDEEAAFWRTKLPSPDPVTALKMLSERFPPDIHPSNLGKFLDVERRPFGFLTKLGIEQLNTNGRRFFVRYEQHGHRCPSTGLADTESFMHSWDVKAFSTNYLRTVLSAQCFLDGLLGTNCYKPVESHTELDDDVSRLVPDHSTGGDANKESARVAVKVRDRATDNLNAFDRNPQLIKNLITNVITSEDFLAQDSAAAPLAARLANYLPGLVRKGRKTFGGPSGINWIEATDHFVCRSSHGVNFSRFSEREHENRAECTLEAMEHPTMVHLAWRFRQWYQNAPLLAEIASPALREILEQMQGTTDLGAQERHPFSVYSCHDVTILALLYGLGADFLADEGKGDWRFWPKYGTTLVFELVRIQDDAGKSSHVVRVLLNGKPVRAVNLMDYKGNGPPEYVGKGPMNMLTVADFEKIIDKLEDIGGMPHELVPKEEPSFMKLYR